MRNKFGKFLIAVLVLVLGLGAGYFGGNLIASKKYVINPYQDIDQNSLYDDINLIDYENKTPDQLTGTDVFVVANYLYDHTEKWTNYCTGTITTSVGIKQDSYQINSKDGDYYKCEITTIGAFMSNAKKIETVGKDKLKITTGKANQNDIKASTWEGSVEEITLEDFIEMTGSSPNENTSYIISSKTVIEQSDCQVKNGIYTFVLKLDNTKSVIKYAKQIAFFSGIKEPPEFLNIELNFSVDKNFKLVKTHRVEKYIINYSGIKVTVDSVIDNTY